MLDSNSIDRRIKALTNLRLALESSQKGHLVYYYNDRYNQYFWCNLDDDLNLILLFEHFPNFFEHSSTIEEINETCAIMKAEFESLQLETNPEVIVKIEDDLQNQNSPLMKVSLSCPISTLLYWTSANALLTDDKTSETERYYALYYATAELNKFFSEGGIIYLIKYLYEGEFDSEVKKLYLLNELFEEITNLSTLRNTYQTISEDESSSANKKSDELKDAIGNIVETLEAQVQTMQKALADHKEKGLEGPLERANSWLSANNIWSAKKRDFIKLEEKSETLQKKLNSLNNEKNQQQETTVAQKLADASNNVAGTMAIFDLVNSKLQYKESSKTSPSLGLDRQSRDMKFNLSSKVNRIESAIRSLNRIIEHRKKETSRTLQEKFLSLEEATTEEGSLTYNWNLEVIKNLEQRLSVVNSIFADSDYSDEAESGEDTTKTPATLAPLAEGEEPQIERFDRAETILAELRGKLQELTAIEQDQSSSSPASRPSPQDSSKQDGEQQMKEADIGDIDSFCKETSQQLYRIKVEILDLESSIRNLLQIEDTQGSGLSDDSDDSELLQFKQFIISATAEVEHNISLFEDLQKHKEFLAQFAQTDVNELAKQIRKEATAAIEDANKTLQGIADISDTEEVVEKILAFEQFMNEMQNKISSVLDTAQQLYRSINSSSLENLLKFEAIERYKLATGTEPTLLLYDKDGSYDISRKLRNDMSRRKEQTTAPDPTEYDLHSILYSCAIPPENASIEIPSFHGTAGHKASFANAELVKTVLNSHKSTQHPEDGLAHRRYLLNDLISDRYIDLRGQLLKVVGNDPKYVELRIKIIKNYHEKMINSLNAKDKYGKYVYSMEQIFAEQELFAAQIYHLATHPQGQKLFGGPLFEELFRNHIRGTINGESGAAVDVLNELLLLESKAKNTSYSFANLYSVEGRSFIEKYKDTTAAYFLINDRLELELAHKRIKHIVDNCPVLLRTSFKRYERTALAVRSGFQSFMFENEDPWNVEKEDFDEKKSSYILQKITSILEIVDAELKKVPLKGEEALHISPIESPYDTFSSMEPEQPPSVEKPGLTVLPAKIDRSGIYNDSVLKKAVKGADEMLPDVLGSLFSTTYNLARRQFSERISSSQQLEEPLLAFSEIFQTVDKNFEELFEYTRQGVNHGNDKTPEICFLIPVMIERALEFNRRQMFHVHLSPEQSLTMRISLLEAALAPLQKLNEKIAEIEEHNNFRSTEIVAKKFTNISTDFPDLASKITEITEIICTLKEKLETLRADQESEEPSYYNSGFGA